MNLNNSKLKSSPALRAAVDGMLCAVAVVGRIALGFIPNVQPVTAILILMGAYIGVCDAAISAVVVVIVTNLLLGTGIWSIWQMIVWASIGVLSGIFFRECKNPILMLIWAVASGYIYGAVISIWSWNSITASSGGYVAYWLAGLPYDTYHALGNGVFIWFLQPIFAKFTGEAGVIKSGKSSK